MIVVVVVYAVVVAVVLVVVVVVVVVCEYLYRDDRDDHGDDVGEHVVRVTDERQ